MHPMSLHTADPSTVPEGPAASSRGCRGDSGTGELPTRREGRWVGVGRRAGRSGVGAPGRPGARHPRREALTCRSLEGPPRPAREGRGRGGQRGTTGEAPGDARRGSGGTRGGGQVAPEGCGSRAASAAPHLPSARFMPASAAQRGSAGPGPARYKKLEITDAGLHPATLQERLEDLAVLEPHSCWGATGETAVAAAPFR